MDRMVALGFLVKKVRMTDVCCGGRRGGVQWPITGQAMGGSSPGPGGRFSSSSGCQLSTPFAELIPSQHEPIAISLGRFR